MLGLGKARSVARAPQRIALPSSQQVARALKPIGARLDGLVRPVNDNEALLRSLHGPDLWTAMASAVEQGAADILLQTHREGYRAALFAIGLMPALIALGGETREQMRHHADAPLPRERPMVLAGERAPR